MVNPVCGGGVFPLGVGLRKTKRYVSQQPGIGEVVLSFSATGQQTSVIAKDDIGTVSRYNASMTSVDRLFKEAAQLPEDQRLTLAHRLLVSGEPPPTSDVELAWDLEIRERIKQYEESTTRSRPASEVFLNLDKKLTK